MAEVILEAVSKRYDNGALAVDRVSLTVRDGEFLVLVGPSGCGKSTTLRMIAGLEEITSGTIRIAGRVVNNLPPKDRDIAMVFQNYALYPHMTVYENMAFGLKLRHVPKPEIVQRVSEAAEILGLQDYLARLPKQLSGGQRQRVAVGRAIVRKPKVFLFDEPLSNLDAKMRVEMRGEITRLHRHLGATMIYVTHDQIEAMTMSDRIVVMDRGRVQQVDAPMAIYRQPANRFVAEFIGTPPMNMVPGRVAAGRFTCASGSFALPAAAAALPAGEVLLGCRPETLRLAAPEALFRGSADLVEPMGAETFIGLTLGDGTRVIARVEPEHAPKVGTPAALGVDPERLSFFNPVTGARLV